MLSQGPLGVKTSFFTIIPWLVFSVLFGFHSLSIILCIILGVVGIVEFIWEGEKREKDGCAYLFTG